MSKKEAYEVHDLAQLDALALERGCRLIRAARTDLLLDLDSYIGAQSGFTAWLSGVRDTLQIIDERFVMQGVSWWCSRSKHLHVRIALDESYDIPLLIGLQAVLGSDPRRETLALWEFLKTGDEEDTRSLFQPLEAVIHKVDASEVFA